MASPLFCLIYFAITSRLVDGNTLYHENKVKYFREIVFERVIRFWFELIMSSHEIWGWNWPVVQNNQSEFTAGYRPRTVIKYILLNCFLLHLHHLHLSVTVKFTVLSYMSLNLCPFSWARLFLKGIGSLMQKRSASFVKYLISVITVVMDFVPPCTTSFCLVKLSLAVLQRLKFNESRHLL